MWKAIGGWLGSAGKILTSFQSVGYHRKVKSLRGRKALFVLRSGDRVIGVVDGTSVLAGTLRVRSVNPQSSESETIRIREIDHFRELGDSDEPSTPFTVERNHLTVFIADNGETSLSREESIVPNSPGLETYRDVYVSSIDWDVGTAWARMRQAAIPESWIPATLELLEPGERFTPGIEFVHRFNKPLVRGRTYHRESGASFPVGTYLVDEQDSFEHTVRHVEREFAVEIQFPPSLGPAGVSVTKINEYAYQQDLGSLPVENNKVRLDVSTPAVGNRFVLSWSNVGSVRRSVSEKAAGSSGDLLHDGLPE